MSGQVGFRVLLTKLQGLLSETDRIRLNLRDNPLLSETLSALESRFDKDAIDDQDCDYLIEVFQKIHCYDAAKRLQEYRRARTQRNGLTCSLQDILMDDHSILNEQTLGIRPSINQFQMQEENLPRSRLFNRIFRKPCGIREIIWIVIVTLCLLALSLTLIFRTKCVPTKRDIFLATLEQMEWKEDGLTVVGGNGIGNELNQLNYPWGIFIDKNNSIYIADCLNHRILKWKTKVNQSEIVAGGNGMGSQIDQFNCPADVMVDEEKQVLFVCDRENRRVVQWSLVNISDIHIIVSDIDCFGMIMDNEHSLYVSDWTKHEVIRLKQGEKKGVLIAGGNGKGNHSNQFNYPSFMCIDAEHSIYVSDIHNHRIMKWKENAKNGILVAGGNGDGNRLNQLSYPRGVIVDELERIYVSDNMNHRVVRWCKGCSKGEIIAGGNGAGQSANQLTYPTDLSFDRKRNLHVADSANQRILKYEIDGYDIH